MNTRSLFGYILSILVLAITLMALLGIWGIIDWTYLRQYFGKTVQSMIIILVSAVVLYLIQSLLLKKETNPRSDESENGH